MEDTGGSTASTGHSLPPTREEKAAEWRWEISGPLTVLCTPPPTAMQPLSLPPCKEVPVFWEVPQREASGLQLSVIRIFVASRALSGSLGLEGQRPSSARPGPSSGDFGVTALLTLGHGRANPAADPCPLQPWVPHGPSPGLGF